jgi:chromosome segregation ATPase
MTIDELLNEVATLTESLKRAEAELAKERDAYDKLRSMLHKEETDGKAAFDLSVECRARAVKAEAELASLADTIAAAHRNTEMSGEGVEPDLREGVWQLSYRANSYRAERDTLRALLAGFSGPPPSPRQWADICNKAAELRAALREGK